jgi:hypothetical protein
MGAWPEHAHSARVCHTTSLALADNYYCCSLCMCRSTHRMQCRLWGVGAGCTNAHQLAFVTLQTDSELGLWTSSTCKEWCAVQVPRLYHPRERPGAL